MSHMPPRRDDLASVIGRAQSRLDPLGYRSDERRPTIAERALSWIDDHDTELFFWCLLLQSIVLLGGLIAFAVVVVLFS